MEQNLELFRSIIDKLPENIREKLPEDEFELIERMSILPESIAEGTVVKILIEGSLSEIGKEIGLIYLCKGASIKPHEHKGDTGEEAYVLIEGKLVMDGVSLSANLCKSGGKHWIDTVEEDTMIGTYKVREGLMIEKGQDKGEDR